MATTDERCARIDVGGDVRSVVAGVLSRYLGESSSAALDSVRQLNRILPVYANTAAVVNGKLVASELEPLPETGWSGGEVSLRRLGLEREDIAAMWRSRFDRVGVAATFETEILTAFFPGPLWSAVALLVADGPSVASDRLDRAARRLALDPVRPTRARPAGGTISSGTIRVYYAALRRLMVQLVWLNARGHPARGVLREWRAVPPRSRIPGSAANTDRSPPPRRLLRLVWQAVERDVLARLNCERPHLFAAVSELSRRQLKQRAVHKPLRDLVALSLFAVVGSRVLALTRTRRSDFDLSRARWDGTAGPALCIRPGKTRGDDVESWKPLPGELADLIRALCVLVDRVCGEQGPETPLLVGNLSSPLRAIAPNSLSIRFAGTSKNRPVVPRDPAAIGVAVGGLTPDQHHGYSAHSLRHAADQLARAAARAVENALDIPLRPDQAADVLLDHDLPDDRYGYGGMSSRHGRERITGLIAERAWRLLTTEAGAIHVVDSERLTTALELRAALEQRLMNVRRELDRRHEQLRRAAERPRGAAPPAQGELLRVLSTQIDVSALAANERRLSDRLSEVERQVHRLKYDPGARVPVPDDVSPAEAAVDVPRLELAVDGSRMVAGRRTRRVRDFITSRELATLAGSAESTVRKWLAGERLPHPPGDPRNPFELNDIPVDRSWGPRRMRVWADRLKPSFIDTGARRDALEGMLAVWPARWGDPPQPPTERAPGPASTQRDHSGTRGYRLVDGRER